MKKLRRSSPYRITQNLAFDQVVLSCKTVARKDQEDTWITSEMLMSYIQLHRAGYAKSFEVWKGEKLVGGLYGVELDNVFCGESMFSLEPNTSKLAFIEMVEFYKSKGFNLIDCQVYNSHLASLGAEEISRNEFLTHLKK
jgi:leucyl/phenylalanyl-tRNA--protein transferase